MGTTITTAILLYPDSAKYNVSECNNELQCAANISESGRFRKSKTTTKEYYGKDKNSHELQKLLFLSIQWVPETLFTGIKRPGHETVYSLPSSAEVKNLWSYNYTLAYVFTVRCLIKQWIHLHGAVLA
jgi:hypothetical protein